MNLDCEKSKTASKAWIIMNKAVEIAAQMSIADSKASKSWYQ